MDEKILDIAKVAYQANKAYCESEGDFSQQEWADAEDWQQKSHYNGVVFRMENPSAGPDAQHNAWMEDKLKDGWKYGPEKDPEKKEHHCIVPFDQLPEFQQKKDELFSSIVDALLQKDKFINLKADDMSNNIIANKILRVGLDKQLQNLKFLPPSRERALAITKLQEGIMWLGMDLKRLAAPNPYPNSYNPANDKVEPTADGMKM